MVENVHAQTLKRVPLPSKIDSFEEKLTFYLVWAPRFSIIIDLVE